MAVATAALFTGAFLSAEPRGLVKTLTTAPDGGWTQVIEPRAIERDGILYFAFIDGDDGHVKVGSWDGETTTLFTVGTAPEVDTHDAPSIHIRASDDRLMVFWSGHLGSAMNMRISTNPLDVSAWGAAVDLDAQLGGTAYTYPSIVQLLGETNDPIYLFYRDHFGGAGRMCYSTSTDGGATWAAQTVLASQSGVTPYFVVGSDGDARIDIAISTGHPLSEPPASVHHFMRSGGAWKEADGTALGSPTFTVSALPMIAAGPGWPHGIVTDGPTVAYTIDDVTTTYYVTTWTGSAWESVELADGGALVSNENPMTAAITDADTVYADVLVGSRLELQKWDRGSGWRMIPVTDGSSVDNIYPARIHGGTQRRILWLRGTYTSYLDNSLAVRVGR